MAGQGGIQSHRMQVGGIKTSVLMGGRAETPGVAVVFIHGNPGSGADWMPLARHVAKFSAVVAPDLPGFAGADKPANYGYNVANYANFIQQLVEQLGLERVHLVCHDFGGPFATSWAADHPDRVSSVTMINTGVLIGYSWHRLARVWRTPLLGELAMRATNRAVAKLIISHDNPGLSEPWVETLAGLLVAPATKKAVLELYRSGDTDQMAAVAPRLKPHNIPALVVFGEADVYIPAAQAYRQTEAFPHVEIRTLPGLGHWCWFEQPDQVTDIVVPFLRRQVATSSSP